MINCIFENGHQANLRHVTVGMIVIKNDQLLLEKRAAFLTCGGKIALPGGYIDQNERIFAGAQREVMEETGYQTSDPMLFLINDKPVRKQEDKQNIEFTILLKGGEQTGIPDKETTSIFWTSLNNIPAQELWAFDHFEEVERYIQYLKNPCPLPIINFTYR